MSQNARTSTSSPSSPPGTGEPLSAAIILAGGRSERMGGRDKTRATIGGRTALEQVLTAAPPGARIVVGPEGVDGADLAVAHDARFVREDPPGGGPLAGLERGAAELEGLPADAPVLVLGGDMPLLREGTLRELLASARADGAVHALRDEDGRTQYLCAAWPLRLLRERLAHLAAENGGALAGRGLRSLYRALPEAALILRDTASEETADIDTPEDLAAARAARGVRVALAQLTIPEHFEELRALIARTAADAAARGARILVLPEATLTPFGTDLAAAARAHAGPFEELVQQLADRHGLVVVAGSFTPVPGDEGKVRNTLVVRGPSADAPRISVEYDKIHLYDAHGHQESATVEPGGALACFDLGGIRFGLATCYDVRFPEQFAALARAGAHAVLLPVSWADGPGKAEQLRILLRARALDATVAILAADQVPPSGYDGPGSRGVGGTAAIGPLGEVRGELAPGELGLVAVDVDIDAVLEARAALPVLDHGARALDSGALRTLRS